MKKEKEIQDFSWILKKILIQSKVRLLKIKGKEIKDQKKK